MKSTFIKAAVATAAMTMTSAASAGAVFQGEWWNLSPNTIDTIAGAKAAVSSLTPTATFQSTKIEYGDQDSAVTRPPSAPSCSSPTQYCIGNLSDFLNHDAGTIAPASEAATYIQESVFRFTGKASLTQNQVVNFFSDDGYELIVDGTSYGGVAGLTAPAASSVTYTGASGVYDIELWFFEGNETQVVLKSDLAPVPLPAALWLFGSALLGMAGIGYRRTRKA